MLPADSKLLFECPEHPGPCCGSGGGEQALLDWILLSHILAKVVEKKGGSLTLHPASSHSDSITDRVMSVMEK